MIRNLLMQRAYPGYGVGEDPTAADGAPPALPASATPPGWGPPVRPVLPQELAVKLPGPGPSAGPPPPARPELGARQYMGAALMGMGGNGQLGQMLLQRKQKMLDDDYDRMLRIHMGKE